MVSSYQGKLKEQERRSYPVCREFMCESFVSLKPTDDIFHAMKVLIQHKISGAPVVDDSGHLLGIISEKDCIRLARREIYENVTPGGEIQNFMTKNVITVTPDTGLADIADLFLNYPIHKIPVIEDDKLVALIRRRDLLTVLVSFNNDCNSYIRTQENHG